LRHKDFGWVNDFVNKYSYKVNPRDRDNMFYYGNAYLQFNQGYYVNSLKSIQNIDDTFFIYKVDIKNLTLMNYYFLDYTEEALTVSKSYREFIRQNKILSPERKSRYINFSKYYDKVILFKTKSLRKDIGYLEREISKHSSIAFKAWLMERIAELRKDFGKAV
jgi:hypothetical protein